VIIQNDSSPGLPPFGCFKTGFMAKLGKLATLVCLAIKLYLYVTWSDKKGLIAYLQVLRYDLGYDGFKRCSLPIKVSACIRFSPSFLLSISSRMQLRNQQQINSGTVCT